MPDDQEVCAETAQAVFAFDSAAAVDDALQEGLQEKLRACLLVLEALDPVFGVLAEEILEGGEQLVDLEFAFVDVPLRACG